jgi:hypothetical protein
MGIRFSCPNGHKLHVKEFLAGKRGVCPSCGAKFVIPLASAAESPRTVRATSDGGTSSSARASVDASGPSIIISIVEPSRGPLPRAASNPAPVIAEPVALSAATVSAPVVATERRIGPIPLIESELTAPDASLPVAPVAKYVAYRMRSRRNQTTLAIGLLIAVIVLAIVLIVVLRNQPTAPNQGESARIGNSGRHVYAANDDAQSKVGSHYAKRYEL